MARRRRDRLRPLSDLVRKAHPMPEQIDAARIFGWWCSELPKRIVAKARPVKLDRGVLFVNVSSSAWAQELHYMVADLMARLRAAQPSVQLRVIRFRVGPLPELPRPRPEQRVRKTPAVPMAALPEDLGRALATVGDDDIRRTIAKAATTSLTRDIAAKSFGQSEPPPDGGYGGDVLSDFRDDDPKRP